MKTTLQKEMPLMVIVLLPFIYLGYIWNKLPDKVPVHWDLNGEIDRFGSKLELLLIPILLPLLVYLIFLVVPKIDPKNKIKNMGKKYQSIKYILTIFMSILALFILYSTKSQSFSNLNYIFLLIGMLYIVFGNYFKTIKANYFIGIRTPWTLENEEVWKATHKFAGRIWFVGGFIVVISSLILNKQINSYSFITVTSIITIIPIVFSYFRFKKIKQGE